MFTLQHTDCLQRLKRQKQQWKEPEKYGSFKEKKKSTEIVPEKNLHDRGFKAIILKEAQRTKGKYEKSHENYVLTIWKYQ
jgi:hypothetical protein